MQRTCLRGDEEQTQMTQINFSNFCHHSHRYLLMFPPVIAVPLTYCILSDGSGPKSVEYSLLILYQSLLMCLQH